ncbi:MAG: hypothetical protein DRI61_09440 [Chloroflexi bacterium]|nr:MAG: hypothetical protein DRI61_09440 [Chloroflexota bacterium]
MAITYATYVGGDQDRIDYTPSSAVSAGDVILQVGLLGVALSDMAASEKGALATAGIYDVAKVGSAIDAGDVVYWDVADNEVNETASGNTKMGYAIDDAAAGDATVRLIMMQG